MLLHHHCVWEEISKQQCLWYSSAPRLKHCSTSSPLPAAAYPNAGLTRDDCCPQPNFLVKVLPLLSAHLSYIITPSKCCKVFQHHWNITSEDEKIKPCHPHRPLAPEVIAEFILHSSWGWKENTASFTRCLLFLWIDRKGFPLQTPDILFLTMQQHDFSQAFNTKIQKRKNTICVKLNTVSDNHRLNQRSQRNVYSKQPQTQSHYFVQREGLHPSCSVTEADGSAKCHRAQCAVQSETSTCCNKCAVAGDILQALGTFKI